MTRIDFDAASADRLDAAARGLLPLGRNGSRSWSMPRRPPETAPTGDRARLDVFGTRLGAVHGSLGASVTIEPSPADVHLVASWP